MKRTLVIRGESFVTAAVVAEWYEVEESWVVRVCEEGLLAGERVGETLAISVALLDRVAEIRRLELQLGLDLERIALLLSRP